MDKLKNEKLSWKTKICYGIGSGSFMFVDFVFITLAMVLYTDVFGLDPAKVGTMLLIAKVWDAINDPMMGMIVDKTKSKKGKARPYLLYGPIPLAIFLFLMCTVPNVSPELKLAWAYFTYIGVGMAYTVVFISLMTLMPRIAPNLQDRLTLNQLRMIVTGIVGTAIGGSTMPIINKLGNGDMGKGFQIISIIFGTLMVLCVWLLYFNSKEPIETEKVRIEKRSILSDLKALLSNGPFIILAIVGFVISISSGVMSGAFMHYLIYVMKNPGLMSILMPIMYIGGLTASFGAGFIVRKFGKNKTLYGAVCIVVVANAIRYITKDANASIYIAMITITTFATALYSVCFMPMISDTIEYGEWKTGIRLEGLTMSAYSMQAKIGAGVGTAILGYVLKYTGYVPNVAQQNEATIIGLRHCNITVGIIAFGLAAILLMANKMDEKRIKELMTEVDLRKNVQRA